MPEVSSELIANLIAVVIGLGVGTPILLKGLRAGDKPTIYLGLAVFLEGLEWLLWGVSLYTPLAGTPLGEASAVGCRLAITGMVAPCCSLRAKRFGLAAARNMPAGLPFSRCSPAS